MRGVTVRVDGATLLDGVEWRVRPGERWVVLGPNGSGKTTLLRVASLRLHPARGEVELFGARLGHVDVRRLRQRIGVTSASVANALRDSIRAVDVVVTALHGALEPWWHSYSPDDMRRAERQLVRFGVGDLADHAFSTLSSGERQRVLLARALVTDPSLLLLDEPTAGLDLGGREELVADLTALAADPSTPPLVLVTHHLEEVPANFTHGMLLRGGRVEAAGPIDQVLADGPVSECFGVAVEVSRQGGRWSARAR